MSLILPVVLAAVLLWALWKAIVLMRGIHGPLGIVAGGAQAIFPLGLVGVMSGTAGPNLDGLALTAMAWSWPLVLALAIAGVITAAVRALRAAPEARHRPEPSRWSVAIEVVLALLVVAVGVIAAA